MHRMGNGSEDQRMAVFRALQLGDLLCAVPALRAIRAAFPRSPITLIGLPWAAAFVRRFHHLLDGFIPFPGSPGLPEQPVQRHHFAVFLEAVQNARFDLVFQLHGSGTHTNAIVRGFGARRSVGFYSRGTASPDPLSYFPYPDHLREVQRNLHLAQQLGLPLLGEQLEFPIFASDRDEARQLMSDYTLFPGHFVCIHPGARARARRWPPAYFAKVADALEARGLKVVLTGTADEWPITEAVAEGMRGQAVNLAGVTSLGGLAALLDASRLLVCNDTGISHIAAALEVPSVVVFTGSDPRRWAPADGLRHRSLWHAVSCRPCDYGDCPIGQPCATGLATERVIEAAVTLLERFTKEERCDRYAF